MNPDQTPKMPIPGTLPEGSTVKNLAAKIDENARPSIFIGSSSESLPVARQIKAFFEEALFEVDIWDEGVFERTRSFGGSATNAEQLKNFTDIYDFAIFLFVPDDKIVSQTRTDLQGNFKEAVATRHNVVFEFGLFLGRIGARKSFILFDRQVTDFVEHFFTDLKENLSDAAEQDKNSSTAFRLELYPYQSDYVPSLQMDRSSGSNLGLQAQVETIKGRILEAFHSADIGFLPSTSLAIGYYNNFLDIVVSNIEMIYQDPLDQNFQERLETDFELREVAEAIRRSAKRILYVVIPNSIEEATHQSFKPNLASTFFAKRRLPGITRDMTVHIQASSLLPSASEFVVFDVPTTMNTSREAIEMLTPHADIRTLLAEKERRGFRRALEMKIALASQKNSAHLAGEIIRIINWKSFLTLTGQEE